MLEEKQERQWPIRKQLENSFLLSLLDASEAASYHVLTDRHRPHAFTCLLPWLLAILSLAVDLKQLPAYYIPPFYYWLTATRCCLSNRTCVTTISTGSSFNQLRLVTSASEPDSTDNYLQLHTVVWNLPHCRLCCNRQLTNCWYCRTCKLHSSTT
jgi:hypothetical protein